MSSLNMLCRGPGSHPQGPQVGVRHLEQDERVPAPTPPPLCPGDPDGEQEPAGGTDALHSHYCGTGLLLGSYLVPGQGSTPKSSS